MFRLKINYAWDTRATCVQFLGSVLMVAKHILGRIFRNRYHIEIYALILKRNTPTKIPEYHCKKEFTIKNTLISKGQHSGKNSRMPRGHTRNKT